MAPSSAHPGPVPAAVARFAVGCLALLASTAGAFQTLVQVNGRFMPTDPSYQVTSEVYYGESVAVSGNGLQYAVGAPGTDNQRGSVYVYR